MATTQLKLYNEALTEYLGERELASLTENREPRRVLDSVWGTPASGLARACLEQGHWKFALRGAKLEYTSAITPAFGYRRAFEKPVDCVKLTMLCADEWFRNPLTAYTEEAGFWFADYDELYLTYVSNDAAYGMDLSLWPESFSRYVAASLAARAAIRIKQNRQDKRDLEALAEKLLRDARSKDAMQGPTKFLPPGSWLRSRASGGVPYDRGSKSSLYG